MRPPMPPFTEEVDRRIVGPRPESEAGQPEAFARKLREVLDDNN